MSEDLGFEDEQEFDDEDLEDYHLHIDVVRSIDHDPEVRHSPTPLFPPD